MCIIIKDYCLAADWIAVDRIAEPTYHSSRMWCGGGFGIKSLFWYFGFIFAQLPNRSLCVSLWGSGAVVACECKMPCHRTYANLVRQLCRFICDEIHTRPDPQTSDMPITGGVSRPVIIIFLFPSQEGEAMCLYRTFREFYYWRIELHLFGWWQAHCDLYDFYSQLIRGIQIIVFFSWTWSSSCSYCPSGCWLIGIQGGCINIARWIALFRSQEFLSSFKKLYWF